MCFVLHLGMSPRQVSSEYYNQQLRTLIGFGIFYKDDEDSLQCLNVDLVSDNQCETGFDTVNAFRYVDKLNLKT
jgi:hypothetical protein